MSDPGLESDAAVEAESAAATRGGINRVVRGAVRLLLVALIGVFLGAGLYVGVPAIIRAAIEPVEQNRARILELEQRLDRLAREGERERSRLAGEVAAAQGRATRMGERLAELESHTMALDRDLEQLAVQRRMLAELSDELDELRGELVELERDLIQLNAGQDESLRHVQELGRELDRVRAMHLIVQARVSIADEELAAARTSISAALGSLEAAQDLAAEPAIERLELALEALEANPAAADRDLATAWELLVSVSIPEPTPAPTHSPMPTQAENQGESP